MSTPDDQLAGELVGVDDVGEWGIGQGERLYAAVVAMTQRWGDDIDTGKAAKLAWTYILTHRHELTDIDDPSAVVKSVVLPHVPRIANSNATATDERCDEDLPTAEPSSSRPSKLSRRSILAIGGAGAVAAAAATLSWPNDHDDTDRTSPPRTDGPSVSSSARPIWTQRIHADSYPVVLEGKVALVRPDLIITVHKAATGEEVWRSQPQAQVPHVAVTPVDGNDALVWATGRTLSVWSGVYEDGNIWTTDLTTEPRFTATAGGPLLTTAEGVWTIRDGDLVAVAIPDGTTAMTIDGQHVVSAATGAHPWQTSITTGATRKVMLEPAASGDLVAEWVGAGQGVGMTLWRRSDPAGQRVLAAHDLSTGAVHATAKALVGQGAQGRWVRGDQAGISVVGGYVYDLAAAVFVELNDPGFHGDRVVDGMVYGRVGRAPATADLAGNVRRLDRSAPAPFAVIGGYTVAVMHGSCRVFEREDLSVLTTASAR